MAVLRHEFDYRISVVIIVAEHIGGSRPIQVVEVIDYVAKGRRITVGESIASAAEFIV
jgi:hypothetical protein